MRPQFIVVPTAFLIARFLSWTPNFIRFMMLVVSTVAAVSIATVVHIYQQVNDRKLTDKIWVRRAEDGRVKKALIRRGILRNQQKDRSKFDQLYRPTTYYRYELEQLMFLAAQLVVMASIGLGVPTKLRIYPPLLVQSVLIPLTLLTHPVFMSRVVKRRVLPGCYGEVTEESRPRVEAALA